MKFLIMMAVFFSTSGAFAKDLNLTGMIFCEKDQNKCIEFLDKNNAVITKDKSTVKVEYFSESAYDHLSQGHFIVSSIYLKSNAANYTLVYRLHVTGDYGYSLVSMDDNVSLFHKNPMGPCNIDPLACM